MPLSEIDWTKGDPRARLTAWVAATADALAAQASGEPLAVATDTRTREAIDAVTTTSVTAGETPPTLTAPGRFTDRFGVTVTREGQTAAAVLFVTPDNKSDSDASLAFAVRAAAFVNAGVGVVIVDAVPGPPSWATHLHSLVGVYPLPRRPRNGDAPVLIVQPQVNAGAEQYLVWHHNVPAGAPLPTVHVPVRGANLELDLEAALVAARA